MTTQFTSSVPCGSCAFNRWALAALAVTLTAVATLSYSAATARGQQAPRDPIDTVTEAENVPREAEQAPQDAQPLPAPAANQPAPADRASQASQPLTPPTKEQGTTAAAMTAPPARIDFRHFGVKFGEAAGSTQGQTPSEQARPAALTISKIRTPSAASQLGLKVGDQIISVGGEQVATAGQIGQVLEKALSSGPPENHVAIPLVVLRNGVEQTLTISNAQIAVAGYGPLLTTFGHYIPPQHMTGYRGTIDDPHIPANPRGAYLGVELDSQFGDAAIVSRVLPGTPAAQAGLQPGDRIFAINNQRVESPNELIYWVGQMQPGDAIEISFDRAHDVEVTLGVRAPRASERPAATAPAPGE